MVYWLGTAVAVGPDVTVLDMTRLVADAALLLLSGSVIPPGAAMVALLVTAQAEGLTTSIEMAVNSAAED